MFQAFLIDRYFLFLPEVGIVKPVKFTRDSGCLARDELLVISKGDHKLIYIFLVFQALVGNTRNDKRSWQRNRTTVITLTMLPSTRCCPSLSSGLEEMTRKSSVLWEISIRVKHLIKKASVALACERRRISGCHLVPLFSAEPSDSRKYVCVHRLLSHWLSFTTSTARFWMPSRNCTVYVREFSWRARIRLHDCFRNARDNAGEWSIRYISRVL